ncbi:MAG TPA: hypothetical protein VKU00_28405 [Chthonomonadaceae bacterium]|nr:hypothetical protein [Chthonomonadaceae bacterium]
MKRTKCSILSLVGAVLTVLALAASRPAAADSYTITELGALPGYTYDWTWQQTINNYGLVAAYANNTLDPNAFFGDASYLAIGNYISPLPGLPNAVDTIAFGLNNRGMVVGRSTQPGMANSPVLWDGSGAVYALPELPGDNKGGALLINDGGQIVGYSADTSTGIRRAVTWINRAVSLLPTPAGAEFGEALGINDAGEIVGFAGPEPGLEHIMLWRWGM